jgi:hypothetical protein
VGKNSFFKIGGFVGSMALGAALVGAAVTGTGAYFTDSDGGSLKASSGHLTLNTDHTNLTFADLVPGEDKVENIDFNVNASGKSDVWLVFSKDDAGYAAWTGPKGDPLAPGGGMGRFGHFAVAYNGGGALFQTWNLQNLPPGSSDPVCEVNAFGHGSGVRPVNRDDTPPLCGVPAAIKIASNLNSGDSGAIGMTFGVTGRQTVQNQQLPTVPFKIVATQAGISPTASDF